MFCAIFELHATQCGRPKCEAHEKRTFAVTAVSAAQAIERFVMMLCARKAHVALASQESFDLQMLLVAEQRKKQRHSYPTSMQDISVSERTFRCLKTANVQKSVCLNEPLKRLLLL